MLDHVDWSPECAVPSDHNVTRALPPPRLPLLRKNGGEVRKERREIPALWIAGLTASILIREGREVHRNVVVHGLTLVEEPEVLYEVALPYALRILHEWYLLQRNAKRSWGKVVAHAGDHRAMAATHGRFPRGALALNSAAASPLVDDSV